MSRILNVFETISAEKVEEIEKLTTAAQTTADEAKTTADTAAASVNEYMDALLGLTTTDETGATDAE